jgi:23S rRNA pseudouridine2604 synthase
MDKNKTTRLNKYLSETGYCSRRAADKLISEKRVTVNNKIPEMGTKISPTDEIRVDGKLIKEPASEHIYIAFNKPPGIVCTTDTKAEKDNIIDFINHPRRIFPIGRLDKPSQGLIFLTSDGDIVNKILRAGNKHEKEYVVKVNKPVTSVFVEKMSKGIPILGTVTKKCKVRKTGSNEFNIILQQGLNRQIRRMCEFLDYKVIQLKRIRVMNIELDMPIGKWRYFTNEELATIEKMVENSKKTHE